MTDAGDTIIINPFPYAREYKPAGLMAAGLVFAVSGGVMLVWRRRRSSAKAQPTGTA